MRGDPETGSPTIQGNQTILGSGMAIEVRGATSGTVATFTDAGARPTQVSNFNGLLLSGDNIHVAGMNVQANSSYGIRASGRSNVVLNQLGISGSGNLGDGVRIDGNNGDVRIFDTVIENTIDDGIEIFGTNHDVTISGSTITNVQYGIYNIADNGSMTLIDTTLSNLASEGLLLSGSGNAYTLSGVTLADIGNDGIRADGTLNSLEINNSAFAGTMTRGLYLTGNPTVSGTGNTRVGATFTSIFCSSNAWPGSVEFDGTVYTNADC